MALQINKESTREYDRSLFTSGYSWSDIDGDCMDTRAEVLAQTSLIPVVMDRQGCRVIAGLWHDPYGDTIFEDPSQLDIDHIVPLKEAFESGADLWSRERKIRFSNDYQRAKNLVPVWKSLNRSKGALEPQQWMPPNNEYRCDYVTRWSFVKWYWQLTVDVSECLAIKALILSCDTDTEIEYREIK